MKFAYPFQTRETNQQLLSSQGSETEIVPALARLGYDGVELLIRNPKKANLNQLITLVDHNNLKIAALNTGPMVADDDLSFSSNDYSHREEAIKRVIELIPWAQSLAAPITVGKLRGQISETNKESSWKMMREAIERILFEAEKREVKLLIEPQNKVNMNNLNETTETLNFIREFNSPNLGIMLDTYHLNEEKASNSINKSIMEASQGLSFIHISDCNRLSPGDGYFNFKSILNTLIDVNYDSYVSLEINQQNQSLHTAKRALTYLKSIIDS
ncbi:sugar phosphate isomerase/epimerase family protein [Geomicrobium sp. JCM 19055]|uniref:sugar phosphate isomerase/epimerase family protein n=1 Tax=Geomicrobium sp. JCM 19055 TaxID=1460649 RepID=UPI00045ECF50|nr:sugar phosphate isomerase/epimerase family protein [Geomicrobium sp. JCM 19055]GAJ99885.1 D-tagatose 3-epimerase [Geomicrobium sp. JCM 19055]